MKKSIFNKLINPSNKKISVIAEMSGNHRGSFEGSKKFIFNAIKYGADIIKFQVYRPNTITLKSNKKDFLIKSKNVWSKYKTLYDLYEKAYTPWNWIQSLAKILDSKKFPWFASPFDPSAIEFLEKLKCPAYKLASPEITDINLIEKISLTNKPIFISTGLATFKDIDLAIKTIKKKHNKFAILKCVSAYPTPYKDLNLETIKTLKKKYKCAVGFSDHTIGDLAAKVAVALGATIIEKHFKVDNDKSSIDSHFSMELSKLKKFKHELNDISICLGNGNLKIAFSAMKNISGRRSLYISKNIRKGEKFNMENIKSVRPSYGMHPCFLKKIIGKKAKKKLQKGERLKINLVEKL